MFEYRPVDRPDEIIPLAKAAFSLRQTEHDAIPRWLRSSLEHGREFFGMYEGERLAAVYMLYSFRMRLRNTIVPMGGIGLLGSRLDVRGRGAVRSMLQGALETMRERGHAVSVLDPFDESFYRRYGWEKFERMRQMEIAPTQIRDMAEPNPQIACEDLPFPDGPSMAFYNDYAADFYTLVQRGESEWERRTKILEWQPDTAARGVVRFSREDQVVGLLGYNLTRKSGECRSTFHVNLLAYREGAVLREMLRYVRRLFHQAKTARLDLPMDAVIWPYLSGRPAKQTIREMFMIRIVSLEALDGLRVDAPDVEVTVEVTDEQAPWNQGIWRLALESGCLAVSPADRPALRCGIGTLSSVLSGFTSFAEMLAAGQAEALETYAGQDLPKTVTFLADYF